jgi:uncharacterized protein YdcH (DUF465 family)
MSALDSFLKTAGDLLAMSSDIKKMDSRIDKLTEENRSLDRRIMKIELMIDLAKSNPLQSSPKELP